MMAQPTNMACCVNWAVINVTERWRKCNVQASRFFGGFVTGCTGWESPPVGSVRLSLPPFVELYFGFVGHFVVVVLNTALLCGGFCAYSLFVPR